MTQDLVRINLITSTKLIFLIVRMLVITILMAYAIGLLFYLFVSIEEHFASLDLPKE